MITSIKDETKRLKPVDSSVRNIDILESEKKKLNSILYNVSVY